MTPVEKTYNRRFFLKASVLSGGGLLLGFSSLTGFKAAEKFGEAELPIADFSLNGYIKITDKGEIIILSPNPEFGQNIKTALPMIAAEELDVDWQKITVEQAPFNAQLYPRQFTGGSQSVRTNWKNLRTAGASARFMLIAAAAQAWNVPAEEITTNAGILQHVKSGKSAPYGEMASAAAKIPVPKEVKLKDVKSFKLINTPRKNVEGLKVVTGKPLFCMDYRKEGMLIAMIVHPPAFGLKLKSFDAASVNKMAGIKNVFSINVFNEGYEKDLFDTRTFNDLIVIVGKSTWEVMNAKKKIVAQWEPIKESIEKVSFFGRKMEVKTPAGLENSDAHYAKMKEMNAKPAEVARKDGNPEEAFAKAHQIIERTYTAPFLAHNTMEPMNCFAHVTADRVFLAAPIQAPEFIEKTISARLGVPLEKIDIEILRMGGGFGRRAYGHYMVEAALISQKMNAPIKLIYTREDDMTYGIYRPSYIATYRAALDADKKLTGFHVRGGGLPETAVHANRFPAGAIDNYLAETWALPTNLTIGAFRAPRSNFIAAAEQSFLDEVAEAMGKDPIDLRLELLKKAKSSPVGKNNEYEADRYIGVLELLREKSNWDAPESKKKHRGVAAYFCHNSYAGHVVDLSLKQGQPVVDKVTSVIDCGIVINPLSAVNVVEGAVVDGVGNAFYGALTVKDGVPEQNNFDTYRMIRHNEAPKAVEVHFVKNEIDPTGLGEPPFPPLIGALANALYKATGKRFYQQPFQPEVEKKI